MTTEISPRPPKKFKIGIDYSINSPGICIIYPSGDFVIYGIHEAPTSKRIGVHMGYRVIIDLVPEIYRKKNLPPNRKHARSRWMAEWMRSKLDNLGVPFGSVVCLEDYALNANKKQPGNSFRIAEHTMILKMILTEGGYVVMDDNITPSAVKKSFCGKGNAKKEVMVRHFEQVHGVNLGEMFGFTNYVTPPSPVTDIVDAYAVATFDCF